MTKTHENYLPQTDRWSFLWLAIGAVLLMLSTGHFSLALAGWFAPVFLIRFFRTQNVRSGYILTLLALFVAYGIAWRSILSFAIFESLPVYLVLALIIGFQNSLPFLADRLLAPHLKSFAVTLIFPLAVTANTFLVNIVNPIGSFGTVGYEQYSNLALIQLVSVTGLWGLTFLVSWFGPVVNWVWERSFAWAQIRRGVVMFAGIVALGLVFGNLRLVFAQPQSGTVRVHGFTPDYASVGEEVDIDTDREAFRREVNQINALLIDGTIREARRGAEMVVWHEMAGGGVQEDANALIARGQEVAQEENIYLAMGVQVLHPDDDRKTENRLIVVDPSGEIVINHLKYGATIIDGIATGDGILQTVDTPFGTLSGVICWDANFPIVVKQAGSGGADILIVPNGEPLTAVAQLHAQQHTFRAIENGVSLIRHDAVRGLSIATDPYGRILSKVDMLTTSEPVMIAQVPTQGVFTVYSVIGDLFGWLTVAGFVLITVWAVIVRRKAKRPEPISSEKPTLV